MKTIERANVLRVGLVSSGGRISFPYEIDDRFKGEVRIDYPFSLEKEDFDLLPPVAFGIAAFLAQLCLTRRIVVDFPCSDKMVGLMEPILEMLYDIRCWRDEQELMPTPDVDFIGGIYQDNPYSTDDAKRACLLWSGGKDSNFSQILLRGNGYEVFPVHFPINDGAEKGEMQSVANLSRTLGVGVDVVRYEFEQFTEIAAAYAIFWDIFPGYNVVPFGRDLLLALLAIPIARRNKARFLCFGHEHGSRNNYFEYRGKRISRDDIESIKGATLIEKYIQELITNTIKFFPPVGGVTEYRILYELFLNYPEVMQDTSFCYWGNSCGRCSKCLRYYLFQRTIAGEELLRFNVNPLEGDNCLDLKLCLDNWQVEDGRSYTNMILHCLATLVENNNIQPQESMLKKFEKEIYPKIKDRLTSMKEALMQVYDDPQIPENFMIDVDWDKARGEYTDPVIRRIG